VSSAATIASGSSALPKVTQRSGFSPIAMSSSSIIRESRPPLSGTTTGRTSGGRRRIAWRKRWAYPSMPSSTLESGEPGRGGPSPETESEPSFQRTTRPASTRRTCRNGVVSPR
jgi:hypothetical protein